ncbi:MAG: type II toxin-antitoxin system HicA family toxin [Candidatus Dormibacteraceae bacterium]
MRWSHNEVVRVLRHFGFALHRHGARHDIYAHPDQPRTMVVVPRHRQIPDPTVRSIWRQAGIARADAEALR